VAAATAAAARRTQRVLCYESPTSLGFSPTHFVNVDGLVEAKLGLIRAHLSQVMKNGLVDLEALEAQARFRGFQARVRHAEAFEPTRFVWDIPQLNDAAEPVSALNKEIPL
jgi:LmbE family N-acetylglucosaminyl deacetylase